MAQRGPLAALALRALAAGLAAPGAVGPASALNVEIMVTTKLISLGRRTLLRRAFRHCLHHVDPGLHQVEHLFFLGDASEASEELRRQLEGEATEFGDLVFVGGPDSDPWVPRDATYVLDRPTSRGYRLAYGTAWLAENRPALDFVAYLDDDSYLHIPKLLSAIEGQPSPSLAMGFVMETMLDSSQTSICDLCKPCEPCLRDDQLNDFCSQFPDMSLGGCLMVLQQCDMFNEGEDGAECVQRKFNEIMRVSQYFGSLAAPRWFLGMGWVFGRRIVDYLSRNVENLKMRGAADVQLGFWLAPLEDVHWVDMKGGFFHDYPMPGSTFSAGCSDRTVLVHRMDEERWKGFEPETCELRCPASATG